MQLTSKYTRLVLKKTMKLSLSGDIGSDSIIIINKMNLLPRYSLAYSSGSSIARAFNAQSPGCGFQIFFNFPAANTPVLLFDAGSAEVFCTILHWCFPGLFPENRCEITLTGKRQGSRNYRDCIIGMAKHILSNLFFFALYIGTDRNSHLFCEQVT